MARKTRNSNIQLASKKLRAKVLALPEGDFLGSEEELVGELQASRNTVRQVARLLEIEGLLNVKRGINGGYYGARPSSKTIEATVTSFLEASGIAYSEVTMTSSALWVEVLRRAASLKKTETSTVVQGLREEVLKIKGDENFGVVYALEEKCRTAFFAMIESPYIEMIFNINVEFASRRFSVSPGVVDGSEEHLEFVRAWRDARLLELSAIANNDEELAVLAARHLRDIWHRRIWISQP